MDVRDKVTIVTGASGGIVAGKILQAIEKEVAEPYMEG
jgi:hypothetical protein